MYGHVERARLCQWDVGCLVIVMHDETNTIENEMERVRIDEEESDE